MSSKNHIGVVDALFGDHMTDPTLHEWSRIGSWERKPNIAKTRRATVNLPDLKTIIVTQDRTDIDDVRPLVLRSTRVAIVEQLVTVAFGWNIKRTERVGLQIARYSFGIDVDDFRYDPEVDKEIREELKIPAYMKLIGAYEVDDIPEVGPDNFDFLEGGGLTDESREQDLNTSFTFLKDCMLLSGTEPKIYALKPRV